MSQNKLTPEELSPLDLINEIQRLKQELFDEKQKSLRILTALKKIVDEGGKEGAITMNQRIAQQILKVRDAIGAGDMDLAYHELYKIASPNFDKMSDEVWAGIEKAASQPTIEIDLAEAIEEGAELWKMEYDNCRKLLEELVTLKEIKETEGKTEDYLIRQPIAWVRAKKFLEKYQHISW